MMTFFLTAAFSSLILLDATYAGQFMLSEPIFMLPLMGFVSGHPGEGMRAGINMEFIFLGRLAVGASVPPFAGFAAAVFWCSAVLSGSFRTPLLVAVFLLSLPAGYWGREVDIFVRRINGVISEYVFEDVVSKGKFSKISSGMFMSLALTFFINLVNICVLSWVVSTAAARVEALMGGIMDAHYIGEVWRYLPLAGMLFLLDRFNDKRNNGYFIAGITGGLLAGVIFWAAL